MRSRSSTTSILMTRNLAERREFPELGSSADGQLLHSEWLRHHENDDHEHDDRREHANEVAAPSGTAYAGDVASPSASAICRFSAGA